jgi:hypothetical protein
VPNKINIGTKPLSPRERAGVRGILIHRGNIPLILSFSRREKELHF